MTVVPFDFEGVRLPVEGCVKGRLDLVDQVVRMELVYAAPDAVFRGNADLIEELPAHGREREVLVEQADRAFGEVLHERPVAAFGLLEPAFPGLSLADVSDDAHPVPPTVVFGQHRECPLDGKRLAVRCPKFGFDGGPLDVRIRGGDFQFPDRLGHRAVDDRGRVRADEFVGGVAEHLGVRLVDHGKPSVLVDDVETPSLTTSTIVS